MKTKYYGNNEVGKLKGWEGLRSEKIVNLWLYETFATISKAGESGKCGVGLEVTGSEKVNKMTDKDIRQTLIDNHNNCRT